MTTPLRIARSYSTLEAQKLAGITYRQITYWMTQGVIEPSVAPARGSGTKALWSARDVRLLRVFGELSHLRCELRTFRHTAEVLAHHCGEGWLLVGPARARLCTIEELVDALEHDEPAWHVLRLSTVLRGLPTDDRTAA